MWELLNIGNLNQILIDMPGRLILSDVELSGLFFLAPPQMYHIDGCKQHDRILDSRDDQAERRAKKL
jgi:hypothetical protein